MPLSQAECRVSKETSVSKSKISILLIQISNVHMGVAPGPTSQDAVIKCIYASPGLQCSFHSPADTTNFHTFSGTASFHPSWGTASFNPLDTSSFLFSSTASFHTFSGTASFHPSLGTTSLIPFQAHPAVTSHVQPASLPSQVQPAIFPSWILPALTPYEVLLGRFGPWSDTANSLPWLSTANSHPYQSQPIQPLSSCPSQSVTTFSSHPNLDTCSSKHAFSGRVLRYSY